MRGDVYKKHQWFPPCDNLHWTTYTWVYIKIYIFCEGCASYHWISKTVYAGLLTPIVSCSCAYVAVRCTGWLCRILYMLNLVGCLKAASFLYIR